MAAMAPALTDASAHPSSFKLPVSPADPGQAGFEATPSDPTSPGLPNGHSNSNHTHIDSDQAIQDSGFVRDPLVKQGSQNKSGINNHRSKVRLFKANSQRGRIPENLRLLGKLEREKTVGTGTYPLSARGPGLNNGGEAVVNNIKKMSHSTVSGANDKQQPCQTSAHVATTMPPETSSLSLANKTDATGSSSTATADSSEAEDDSLGGEIKIHSFDRMDSVTDQNMIVNYGKVSSHGRMLQLDAVSSNSTTPKLLAPDQIQGAINQSSHLAQRARQLVQKLRRLQANHISTHSQRQILSFVQEQHRNLEEKAAEADAEGCPECKRNSSSNLADVNVASTSQELACSAGPDASIGDSHLPRTCNHKRKLLPTRPTDVDVSGNISVKAAARQLQSKLDHVESWVDDDETESSSGGESCDEGDDTLPSYAQTRQKHKIPLHRRAVWKWAVERASIASRWTWLQAQVSDLEYRIRQQSDIYRQTRASKGVAVLGEPSSTEELMKVRVMTSTKTNRKLSPIEAKIARLGGSQEMSPSNLSSLLSNVDRQTARLKKSLQHCVSPMSGLPLPPTASSTPTTAAGKMPCTKPMNGIVGNSTTYGSPVLNSKSGSAIGSHRHSVTNSFPSQSSINPEEHYCARTRPVWYFRKRKLIRTMNMHHYSRKSQKLSSVRCGCCPPLMPCVMCGGRFNHVEKPKEPDMAPLNERVAQLDYSFHPVLSFPQDIPLSLQFEGMMKSNEWQRKPPPSKMSNMKKKRRPSTPTEGKEGRKTTRKYERKDKDKTKRRQNAGEEKSLKRLRKLGAQTRKEMSNGRGDGKILKRPRSKANSLPGTPKNLLTDEINRRCRTDIKKRRAAQLAIAALKKTRARSLSLPNIEDHLCFSRSMSSHPGTPTLGDGMATGGLSHSMPSSSLQNFLKPRRPGGNSDQYDTDNIVIPYSMLASTRVEKLSTRR